MYRSCNTVRTWSAFAAMVQTPPSTREVPVPKPKMLLPLVASACAALSLAAGAVRAAPRAGEITRIATLKLKFLAPPDRFPL